MLPLQTALRHRQLSTVITRRAVDAAGRVRLQGPGAVSRTVTTYQMAQVRLSQIAFDQMLLEQRITSPPDARLNVPRFTSTPDAISAMVDAAGQAGFDRLVASLVQEAGRTAEQVMTSARPRVGYVRELSPPSCSRCAVLAGRVYSHSDGFQRHPGCDCTMTPVAEGNTSHVADLHTLLAAGKITGLSKADRQALADGADFNKVVNVKSQAAGLTIAGRVLGRRGSLTPEGIYQLASDREQAVRLLLQNGYLTS